MRGLWAAFVARCAHREAATSLAAFRVLVGLVVAQTFADMLHKDVVIALWTLPAAGGYRVTEAAHPLWALLGGAGAPQVEGAVWAGLGVGLALALGLGGRLTALVALQLCIALFNLNSATGGGHDKLITNALWLLVLAPATATHSLDCRLRTGRWVSAAPQLAVVRYLAIVQITVVYVATGLQKLGSEWFPWGGYKALYYALLAPSWARGDTAWVADAFLFTQIGTALTWLWELTWWMVPLALYLRATRTHPGRLRALSNRLDLRALYLLIGVSVHVGIALTMDVGPFSWISLAYYAAALHPDEWPRAWRA